MVRPGRFGFARARTHTHTHARTHTGFVSGFPWIGPNRHCCNYGTLGLSFRVWVARRDVGFYFRALIVRFFVTAVHCSRSDAAAAPRSQCPSAPITKCRRRRRSQRVRVLCARFYGCNCSTSAAPTPKLSVDVWDSWPLCVRPYVRASSRQRRTLSLPWLPPATALTNHAHLTVIRRRLVGWLRFYSILFRSSSNKNM